MAENQEVVQPVLVEEVGGLDGVEAVEAQYDGLPLTVDVETSNFTFLAAQAGGGGVDSDGGSVTQVGGFGVYVTVRMRQDFSLKTLEKEMRSAWTLLGSTTMIGIEENFFFLLKFIVVWTLTKFSERVRGVSMIIL